LQQAPSIIIMALTLSEDHRSIVSGILFCPAEERTARELQELPKGDREQVWADMMGNDEMISYRMHAETAEFVEDSIAAFTEELQKGQKSNRSAYDLAVQQNASYVHNQKLKFLRADNFVPSSAASRMFAHFALKLDLFGPQVLARDVKLEDLNEDDLESLKAGGMQVLSMQDHATRPVIFTRAANYVYKDRKNIVSKR
jgi:hypothetical protein